VIRKFRRSAGDVGVMDAAMAAVLSPTLVASTLAILTITAAAQDRDQIGVPVGADVYLTRTFDPAKLIFGGRGHRVRASGRPATRARDLQAAWCSRLVGRFVLESTLKVGRGG
jgi:DNA-binding response OmpR family regulator